MTTISVVIPTRNGADMLAVSLAALARQTRPADEIVVIDNASTDHTAGVCAAAGARRIAVELPGIAASTGYGFDEARWRPHGGVGSFSRSGDTLAPSRTCPDTKGTGPAASAVVVFAATFAALI